MLQHPDRPPSVQMVPASPATFHRMDPPYWQTAGYGVNFPFESYERMADFIGFKS